VAAGVKAVDRPVMPSFDGVVPEQGSGAKARLLRPIAPLAGSIVGVETPEKALGLTFDDGPDPVMTRQALDALAAHGARATFFMLAQAAVRHPDVVREVIAAGHEVGLHGDDHSRLTQLPFGEVARALTLAKARLETVAGRPVRWMRPAFGAQQPRTLLAIRRARMDVVAWSCWAHDWREQTEREMADRALAGVAPGGILLLHDAFVPDPAEPEPAPGYDRRAALDLLLSGLADRGYAATSVGELLRRGPARRAFWFGA
jgi:peptidoglycan/xylan/chitin deacetylase (PgdA/CDA1 family)